MHKHFIFLFFAVLAATGCRQKQVATVNEAVSEDSIDILYFQKPFTDSTRYTRYFNLARVADSSMQILIAALDTKRSSVSEKPRPCLSDGKIVFPKGGDAFKVYYFSRTAGDSCKYVYEIRNGMFYYYPLPDELAFKLNEYEREAVEPH